MTARWVPLVCADWAVLLCCALLGLCSLALLCFGCAYSVVRLAVCSTPGSPARLGRRRWWWVGLALREALQPTVWAAMSHRSLLSHPRVVGRMKGRACPAAIAGGCQIPGGLQAPHGSALQPLCLSRESRAPGAAASAAIGALVGQRPVLAHPGMAALGAGRSALGPRAPIGRLK